MNKNTFKLVLKANYDIKLSNPYCKFVLLTFKDLEEKIKLDDNIYRYYFKARLDNKIHFIDVDIASNKILSIDESPYLDILSSYKDIKYGVFNLLDQLAYLSFLNEHMEVLLDSQEAISLGREYNGSTMKSNTIYKEYSKYMPESIVKLFHLKTMEYIRENYDGKGLELGIKNGDFILTFYFKDSVDVDNSYLRGHIIANIKISQNMSLDEEWHNKFILENDIYIKLNIPYYLFKDLIKFLNKKQV